MSEAELHVLKALLAGLKNRGKSVKTYGAEWPFILLNKKGPITALCFVQNRRS
jgi:hypothetical protein